MPITRRSLLGLLSTSSFFLTAGGPVLAQVILESESSLGFPQGVASGDPRPDSIMLWTRAVPDNSVEQAALVLEMAVDPEFSQLVISSEVSSRADSDYTVRASVDGLQPGQVYYYRFRGGNNSVSRTGRTRTAPAPGQRKDVKVAFASCQSFEQGYYGAWARMLEDDMAAKPGDEIDFVLHLGDFIYERSWPNRVDGTPLSRTIPEFPDGASSAHNRWAVSLADYRHLYKTYLSDPQLQEARARWPFVCTWDDHEFSNDGFQSYSTYEGQIVPDAERKLNANRAWFEFIPTALDQLKEQPAHDFNNSQLAGNEAERNQMAVDSLRIYRRLQWGENLDILLTDNRSYRTPPCLPADFAESVDLAINTVELVEIADAGKKYNKGQPPAQLTIGEHKIDNPARDRAPGSILGQEQRDWFLASLQGSQASWKLWGNSLPLIPIRLDLASLPMMGLEDSLIGIDAWAGYPHEQSVIMDYATEHEITGLVSLSGDHHMHGAGTVSRSASNARAPAVAVDFTVAGISSTPMYEDLYQIALKSHAEFQSLVSAGSPGNITPVWHMTLLDGALPAFLYSKSGSTDLTRWLGPNRANPGLGFVDCTANGYGLAHFSDKQLEVEIVTVTDILKPVTTAPQPDYRARFKLPLWGAGEVPKLGSPEFEGPPPFPFDAPAV